ncbi:MAG: DUF4910 domain-containing protein [Anaerolineae bacterium]|nr:DUF4910 domain-containing protein [Anaerolineae bacterium]
MISDLVSAVKEAYSGPAARQHVAAISQYHRIQASPGYRAAAHYCLEQLRSWGVDAELLSFPANEDTTYWASRMFQEWEATEATLDLIQPASEKQRLADWREEKTSLIQRSLPFDGEAEVAVLEGGDGDGDYEGVDVAGRVVLARGDLTKVYRLAVQQRGALGILFDGLRESPPVRQRIDLPDARQYTSFWWQPGDEPKCFGFVLTPRQGDRLRQLARQGSEPLRVRARVVSRLYDGEIEVVSALIPGEVDEEVLIVAHLCHPQPSANDNASGAGAALEAAHTLQHLLRSGRLPRPRRAVRLLWVPEMKGTFAYLATHEERLGRMVAGLNLDMVGQNQCLCGSSFLIERPPEAMASYVGDLAEALRDALHGSAPTLSGTGGYPLLREAVTGFSGGSDHYILSDPTVGVPTPMLIQWPDRFYHTSEDTIDKVDPAMLALAGGMATAYAYWIARAGEAEARWLTGQVLARGKVRLTRLAQDAITRAFEAASAAALDQEARRAERDLAFRADRTVAALRSIPRLAPEAAPAVEVAVEAIQAAEAQERQALAQQLSWLVQARGPAEPVPPEPEPTDEWTARAEAMVLRRTVRGPVGTGDLLARLTPEDRAALGELEKSHGAALRALSTVIMYWIDGRRNLREVADLAECEVGARDLEVTVRMAELGQRAGFLEPA